MIDLNAYAIGLSDMYDELEKIKNKVYTKDEVYAWLMKNGDEAYGVIRVKCDNDEFNVDVFLHPAEPDKILIAGDAGENYSYSDFTVIDLIRLEH